MHHDFTCLIILGLVFSPAYLPSSLSQVAFDENYFCNFDYSKRKDYFKNLDIYRCIYISLRSIVTKKYDDRFRLTALSLISTDASNKEKPSITQQQILRKLSNKSCVYGEVTST